MTENLSIFAKIINFFELVNTKSISASKINRDILGLAIPAILSNITVPLLGLSDTFISGHLGSERFIAAVAVGSMIVSSLYWLFGFLRMGTTGLTAEAFGRNDDQQRRRIFTASFLLAFFIGLLLILLSWPLARLMLWIMNPSAATAALGEEYFRISILSAPAFLSTLTIIGWMIGCQNTLYPMIVSIGVNVINILLSFYFVFGLETGFYGVALGTCIANWTGLVIALLLARRLSKNSPIWAPLSDIKHQLDVRRFFKVNSDLMIRSACIMTVLFAMTSFGGRMGDEVLASNAVIMQFFMFFSYFMDGFAFSGEALCGKFIGANQLKGIRLTVNGLLIWSLAMIVLFTLIYFFFLTPVTAILTDEQTVITGVSSLKWIVTLIPVISAAAFIFDGLYIGMTATWRLLWTTLLAMLLYFAIMTPHIMGLEIKINPVSLLWCAFLAFLFLRGLLLAILLPSTVKRQLHLAHKL